MMTDTRSFALLLDTGVSLEVESITAVHQARDGTLWLDVRMRRGRAKLNAAHIVAALDVTET